MICGVCRGIANYLDFSLFWTRVITVVLGLMSGLWPLVLAYILAALVMKPEPSVPIETDDDLEFYNSYLASCFLTSE